MQKSKRFGFKRGGEQPDAWGNVRDTLDNEVRQTNGSDPDYLYYNAMIINNSTLTTSKQPDPSITFQDTRSIPILNDKSKYALSVENFSFNGVGKDLPLFIPNIREYNTDGSQNQNPNNTVYDVTFTWRVGNQVYQSLRSVQWTPENQAAWQQTPVSLEQNIASKTYAYPQPEIPYYWCYTYSHWIKCVNTALSLAWGDVKLAAEVGGSSVLTLILARVTQEAESTFTLGDSVSIPVGAVLTGVTSGATADVLSGSGTSYLVNITSGLFQDGETLEWLGNNLVVLENFTVPPPVIVPGDTIYLFDSQTATVKIDQGTLYSFEGGTMKLTGTTPGINWDVGYFIYDNIGGEAPATFGAQISETSLGGRVEVPITFGTKCPFFTYDPKTNLFSLWQDSNTCVVPYGQVVGSPVSTANPENPPNPLSVYGSASGDASYSIGEYSFIGFNTNLEALLTNFATIYYSDQVPYPSAGVLGVQISSPIGNESCSQAITSRPTYTSIISFVGNKLTADITGIASSITSSSWSIVPDTITSSTEIITPSNEFVFIVNAIQPFLTVDNYITATSTDNGGLSITGQITLVEDNRIVLKGSIIQTLDVDTTGYVLDGELLQISGGLGSDAVDHTGTVLTIGPDYIRVAVTSSTLFVTGFAIKQNGVLPLLASPTAVSPTQQNVNGTYANWSFTENPVIGLGELTSVGNIPGFSMAISRFNTFIQADTTVTFTAMADPTKYFNTRIISVTGETAILCTGQGTVSWIGTYTGWYITPAIFTSNSEQFNLTVILTLDSAHTFTSGEVITGTTSGTTAYVTTNEQGTQVQVLYSSGPTGPHYIPTPQFQIGETLTFTDGSATLVSVAPFSNTYTFEPEPSITVAFQLGDILVATCTDVGFENVNVTGYVTGFFGTEVIMTGLLNEVGSYFNWVLDYPPITSSTDVVLPTNKFVFDLQFVPSYLKVGLSVIATSSDGVGSVVTGNIINIDGNLIEVSGTTTSQGTFGNWVITLAPVTSSTLANPVVGTPLVLATNESPVESVFTEGKSVTANGFVGNVESFVESLTYDNVSGGTTIATATEGLLTIAPTYVSPTDGKTYYSGPFVVGNTVKNPGTFYSVVLNSWTSDGGSEIVINIGPGTELPPNIQLKGSVSNATGIIISGSGSEYTMFVLSGTFEQEGVDTLTGNTPTNESAVVSAISGDNGYTTVTYSQQKNPFVVGHVVESYTSLASLSNGDSYVCDGTIVSITGENTGYGTVNITNQCGTFSIGDVVVDNVEVTNDPYAVATIVGIDGPNTGLATITYFNQESSVSGAPGIFVAGEYLAITFDGGDPAVFGQVVQDTPNVTAPSGGNAGSVTLRIGQEYADVFTVTSTGLFLLPPSNESLTGYTLTGQTSGTTADYAGYSLNESATLKVSNISGTFGVGDLLVDNVGFGTQFNSTYITVQATCNGFAYLGNGSLVLKNTLGGVGSPAEFVTSNLLVDVDASNTNTVRMYIEDVSDGNHFLNGHPVVGQESGAFGTVILNCGPVPLGANPTANEVVTVLLGKNSPPFEVGETVVDSTPGVTLNTEISSATGKFPIGATVTELTPSAATGTIFSTNTLPGVGQYPFQIVVTGITGSFTGPTGTTVHNSTTELTRVPLGGCTGPAGGIQYSAFGFPETPLAMNWSANPPVEYDVESYQNFYVVTLENTDGFIVSSTVPVIFGYIGYILQITPTTLLVNYPNVSYTLIVGNTISQPGYVDTPQEILSVGSVGLKGVNFNIGENTPVASGDVIGDLIDYTTGWVYNIVGATIVVNANSNWTVGGSIYVYNGDKLNGGSSANGSGIIRSINVLSDGSYQLQVLFTTWSFLNSARNGGHAAISDSSCNVKSTGGGWSSGLPYISQIFNYSQYGIKTTTTPHTNFLPSIQLLSVSPDVGISGTLVFSGASSSSAYIQSAQPPANATTLTLISAEGSFATDSLVQDLTNNNYGSVQDYNMTNPVVVTKTFSVGDTIEQSGSVSGVIGSITPTNIVLSRQVGSFQPGEIVNLQTGATADILAIDGLLTIIPTAVTLTSGNNWTLVSTPITSNTTIVPVFGVETFTTNISVSESLLNDGDAIIVTDNESLLVVTQLYQPENVVQISPPNSQISTLQLSSPFPASTPTSLPYYTVLTQDYESTSSLWSPVNSIVIATTFITVREEYSGTPITIGTGNLGSNSVASSFQKVLLETPLNLLPQVGWRGQLFYQPTVETLSSLGLSKEDLKNLDIQLYWRNRLTNSLFPLQLYNGGSASIRLLFKKIHE